MKEQTDILLSAWDQINKEKNIWEHLYIKDKAFWFKKDEANIFLSSFDTKDLPESPYPLTSIGKTLTKLSTFANIMSRRPGTEEVTFYSLINQAHSAWCGDFFDKKMLNIAGIPITWRRLEIEKSIKRLLKKYIFDYKEGFAFIDIGSGGGFDSLEIERVLSRMSSIVGKKVIPSEYECLNIDIDTKWLDNNELLSKHIFGDNSRIKRINSSVFDYLEKKSYIDSFSQYDNVIISCNGFAEFLTDNELESLYAGIYELSSTFKGKVSIILPFANRNDKQEKTGNKIGFRYRAKEKDYMIQLVNKTFIDFEVTFVENYSQIVLVLEKSTYSNQ